MTNLNLEASEAFSKPPMQLQVSGSIAFDTIMVFQGRFKDHILADQVHMLNVAFLAPEMRQEFGGCAANIAYGLLGLECPTRLLGAIGKDGHDYLQRLQSLGADVSGVIVRDSLFTAQAFITTDLDDNQITAFHPGAMAVAHEAKVEPNPASLGIVSPNGRQAMLDHAQAFSDAGIAFVFDPGQGLPMFNKDELLGFIKKASWLAVNDYEGEMLSRTVGLGLSELRRHLQPHPQAAVIVTKGSQGVWLDGPQGSQTLDAVRVEKALDPTGCGDAFRAGLLWGLAHGLPVWASCKAGVYLGAAKVQVRGAQNHSIDPAAVKAAALA
ncbi:MAG: carbohydrate kinase family protein [Proteobacteria bacterium]|jgi:adenosine kinase|nr:carbohydrate kinase family protein [Pseudomonadota bacterium]